MRRRRRRWKRRAEAGRVKREEKEKGSKREKIKAG